MKNVELSTPGAKRLESMASIHYDLVSVLTWCGRLLPELERAESSPDYEHDSPLAEALWTAILIAYERCFSGGARLSLQYDDLNAIDPSGGALALHKHYAAMRDKHLAHSVNPFSTTKPVAVLSAQSSGRRAVEVVAVMAAKHVCATAEEVRQLGWLVTQLLERVTGECNSLSTGQVLDEARRLDIDVLYAQEEAHIVIPGPEDVNISRGNA